MDFCDVYLFLHFTSGLIILWVAECVLVSVVELALDIEVHAVMNQEPKQEPLLLFNFSNLDIGRCSDDEEPIEEEIYLCYFSQFLQFRLLLFLLQPLTICRTIHVSEGKRG